MSVIRKQILEFIRSHKFSTGFSPSHQEIGLHVNRTPSVINRHLKLMERDGWIRRVPKTKRNIIVLAGAEQMVQYAFYDCEECRRGFSIEETPDDPIEEPCCPCGSNFARFVGLVELPIPLPIKSEDCKGESEQPPEDENQTAIEDYIAT